MKVGVVMRRKYGRLQKRENIIIFPGTFEKLVRQGINFVENEEYKKAVEVFDQAIDIEPESLEFLTPYAIALYETKDFIRAKEITTHLLHTGPEDYAGTMELYLTILIQLEEYDDVEMNIDVLLDEGFIPQELVNKFSYLRELNNRLAMRYGIDETLIPDAQFTLDDFIEMDVFSQQQVLASLDGTDLRAMSAVLEDIAESVHFSPIVVTFALTLLHQSGFKNELTIRKFGMEKVVVPVDMELPGQDKATQQVLSTLDELLAQDPSRFELAKGLVEKFAITAFPFDWGSYSTEEVADAYVLYIDSLFSGVEIPQTPLYTFIKQLDNESNFENM